MVDELVNPYIAGAPVTEARMFFGREDVFDWIQNSLVGKYADHILVIHGQRRVGKTSVLKQLGNRLPKRYIPVFFDLQGRTHTTLDRFLWWLAREIVRVLKQERGIEIPLPEKEAFSADLEYFENHFLPGLHTSLDGSTLLLTFDEFDNLEESEIKEVLGRPLIDYLRRMMGNKDLNFIFSIGSSGRKLENMQASYTDFFKTALYKKISFLNEEQAHKLVTQPVDGILEYDRSATDCIFRIAGGHPYFTQLTCHELFARCQRTDQRKIREADVEAILDDVVERGTVNLKFVWDEASDTEKWALASLASLDKSDNRTLASYLHKQNVRFSETDLTSGLLHLREKDILTPENRFVIHLLRLWLQKNRPIEQVREELTEVNPIANRYIEIGLEFKNSRQYEKAIESFQEALTVSAGNIQAQVSIALVYMDQKVYDKAVGEFEKALAIDDEDVTARSGLCEAHLALGNTAMQKGRWKEAAQSYQRVLAINDEHTEARQRLAEIHRQRAEKALTDGRDEEALSAFADAIKYAPEDESLTTRVEEVRAEKKAKVIAGQIARSEKEASAKNWEAAVHTLEEAKSLAPDDPNIQKRLDEARGKLRENKMVGLRTKAQGAVKAEKFGEALRTWQEYLSLEPQDREKAEEEIARLKKSQELDETYAEAQQAISEKSYDKAINLLKQVIVQDENFKDTSRLLTQAIELRRSSRPARFTFPIAKILRGLLIAIGIAGLGMGAYFGWTQWGDKFANLFAGEQKVEKVCFLMTGMDDARSYWNSQISKYMDDVAKGYELESKTFITQMVKEEYEAKLTSMIKTEKCDLILGNGTWLKDAFYQYAKEYPDVKFSLIDVDYGNIPRPLPENLIENSFMTFDSGYLAGYLAAGLTETGKVGTFGAEEDNQYINEYMKGFVKGVESYNNKHNTQVQVFGYDIQDGSGLFADGYAGTDVNRELHSIRAGDLIENENVDVLFIVSSPNASEFALESVNKANTTKGTSVKVIGVDIDWAAYFTASGGPSGGHEWANLCITSATKDFERMVKEVIVQAVEGTYQGKTIEMNGSNQGVGLSPFNESIFTIPDDLKSDFAQFQYESFGITVTTEATAVAAPPTQVAATQPTLDPAIQIALDTIHNEEPLYQTNFDTWEFVESYGNARIENGKLIIDGKNTEDGSGVVVNNHASDRYAVEFEIRILETVKNGCGFASQNNVDPSEESWRIIGAGFSSPNHADVGYRKYPDQWLFLSDNETTFDFSKTNKVTLIILGDQITAFVNGQLIYSVQNPLGSAIHTRQQLLGGQVVCEYDNFKYWDLSGVDFPSSAATVTSLPTMVAASATPPPSWVTEIAQPILDTIAGLTPNTQETFDLGIPNWLKETYVKKCLAVVNGEMIIDAPGNDACSVHWTMWYTDFVIEMDARMIPVEDANNPHDRWHFFFRGGQNFAFYYDGTVDPGGSFGFQPELEAYHVLIIVQEQDKALFINNQPIYYGNIPPGWKNGEASWFIGDPVAFDNIKIWDLNNLKNSP